MTLSLNGEVRSTGSGAACLGNPLFAARWLADTMSDSARRCGPATSCSPARSARW